MKLDLETLKYVKEVFDLHSDNSCLTNGYKSLLELIKEAESKQCNLTDVVTSVLCISDNLDYLNLTKGKKYTLIESEGSFFRVINDLGNEQLYFNYRFKKL